jgi:RhoGAP domain/Inhibitor of Apoptosis domain
MALDKQEMEKAGGSAPPLEGNAEIDDLGPAVLPPKKTPVVVAVLVEDRDRDRDRDSEPTAQRPAPRQPLRPPPAVTGAESAPPTDIPSGPPQMASSVSSMPIVSEHDRRKQDLVDRLEDQRAQDFLHRRLSSKNGPSAAASSNACTQCGEAIAAGEDHVWVAGSKIHKQCWVSSSFDLVPANAADLQAELTSKRTSWRPNSGLAHSTSHSHSGSTNSGDAASPSNNGPVVKDSSARFAAKYASRRARSASFRRGWPHTVPTAQQMVDAGFVFQPTERRRDRTRCYFCRQTFHAWTSDDDPFLEHQKAVPTCDAVASASASASASSSSPSMSPVLSRRPQISVDLMTSGASVSAPVKPQQPQQAKLDLFSSMGAPGPASPPMGSAASPPVGNASPGSPSVSVKKGLRRRFNSLRKEDKPDSVIEDLVASAGPPPKIFGVSLAETLVAESVFDFVPLLVRACFDFFEQHPERFDEEGLFRISPDYTDLEIHAEGFEKLSVMSRSVEYFEKNNVDGHVVASLLKKYMRELPEPILTFELYICFIAIWDHEVYEADEQMKREKMKSILSMLPDHNRGLTEALLRFIGKVATHEDKNKMGVSNLGVVFAPSLLRSDEISMEVISESNVVTQVCTKIIEDRQFLMGID